MNDSKRYGVAATEVDTTDFTFSVHEGEGLFAAHARAAVEWASYSGTMNPEVSAGRVGHANAIAQVHATLAAAYAHQAQTLLLIDQGRNDNFNRWVKEGRETFNPENPDRVNSGEELLAKVKATRAALYAIIGTL